MQRHESFEKIKSLGWEPKYKMKDGMEVTYKWIEEQVKLKKKTKWDGGPV